MSTKTETPSAIPVILLGDFEATAKAFSEALLPDFEVVYLSTTPDLALKALPSVLAGQAPAYLAPEDKLKLETAGSGSGSGSSPKAIVIAGPAFDDVFVADAQRLFAAADLHVPFFKKREYVVGTIDDDDDVVAGVGGVPKTADVEGLAARAVKALKKAVEEGKLEGDDDGVYVY
ncbi:hypothetical protein F5Y00DRAFT_256555 [Daldinia vernicosa]|uniref:uncharacterized protein n=1 Tax=Daldinia vernicosa TaxID=114800 RepID=UPI002007ADD4|nr:uncharacterized protein F5Y00DRAFT_256555 [Daldinia vernicosa]KAI0854055.1 hypothetical protein F5Y00DRAFT_256555 [Daldinia vernicosa]